MEANPEDDVWLKQHWLDVILVTVIMLLIVLGLRAIGIFAFFGLPLGLHEAVIAKSDIVSGYIITSDIITLHWTAHHPGTIGKIDQVIGHKTKRDIRRGELLLQEFVEPEAAITKHVIVKTPNGLPAFHILQPDDIELKAISPVPGAFNKLEDVVGRYLLEGISPGVTLRVNQTSATRLSQDALHHRQLLVVPVRADTIITKGKPPALPGDS